MFRRNYFLNFLFIKSGKKNSNWKHFQSYRNEPYSISCAESPSRLDAVGLYKLLSLHEFSFRSSLLF